MDDLPTIQDFEHLFVNNPRVEEVQANLCRFNPIKVMGMERMELRHSAILGWLLSPQETHGLGDAFLRSFLSESLRGIEGTSGLSALDVSEADMSDAEVRREWQNIDLLVLSPRNRWVFIIENKYDSTLHSDQLNRYMETVKSTLMGGDTYRRVQGVFLSLWGEEPGDNRYAQIEYASICELLEQQILLRGQSMPNQVEFFVKHYLEVIQEATSMSQEKASLEKLARQLYRDHRRVLDFIIEHGKSSDFSIACDAVFGDAPEYPDVISIDGLDLVFDGADASTVSFLPKAWFDAFGGEYYYWDGCEDWWAGFPLIMWIQLTADTDGGGGQIRLYAEVGPLTDHRFRRDLIDAISDAASEAGLTRIHFRNGAREEGVKYSKFLKENFLRVHDIHDHEQIRDMILEALRSFSLEIDAVAKVLPQFISHGRAEE